MFPWNKDPATKILNRLDAIKVELSTGADRLWEMAAAKTAEIEKLKAKRSVLESNARRAETLHQKLEELLNG